MDARSSGRCPIDGRITFSVAATNQFQFFRTADHSGSVLQTVNGGSGSGPD